MEKAEFSETQFVIGYTRELFSSFGYVSPFYFIMHAPSTKEEKKFASDLISGTESRIQNDINVFSIGLPFEFGCITASKKEKINFLIGVGGLINIPFATKSEARILYENMEDEVFKNVDNQVNASILSIGLFTGVELRIRDKFILGIEPNVRITPNKFSLFWFQSKSKTVLETGLMFRLRMMGQKPS